MDSFNDPEIEHIILVFGTQGGKTECIFNMMGYAIDQDPGPMLLVYPDDQLAKRISENRVQPAIKLCPTLAEKFDERRSDLKELQFDNTYIALEGANSPAKLASRPIRYLFRDEIDKFADWSGKEADPLKLSEERTKTFWNKKIVDASTPTLKTGNIWQFYQKASVRYKYYVPCPHCGHYQKFEFKQIKWPQDYHDEPDLVREHACYECINCGKAIEDRHKLKMLRAGRWECEEKPKGKITSVAYHLSSIYSPFVTFGRVAYEFLTSKDEPAELMNFINSWLAEPWESEATKMRSDAVLMMAADHMRGQVPDEAIILTCGIDVQKDHFWWTVRAWGEKCTSWNVDYGRAETWPEIDEIINRAYPSIYGEAFYINLVCMDSGYNTDEVYDYAAENLGLVLPTKGSSKPLRARYIVTKIDKGNSKANGLNLYIFDPMQFKDFIFGRLNRKVGSPGSWMVAKDCERLYADQICSEQKVVITDKKGRTHEEYVPIMKSHPNNHLLDAECNAALAAEILGVRYLVKPTTVEDNQENNENDRGSWIGRRNWFNK